MRDKNKRLALYFVSVLSKWQIFIILIKHFIFIDININKNKVVSKRQRLKFQHIKNSFIFSKLAQKLQHNNIDENIIERQLKMDCIQINSVGDE